MRASFGAVDYALADNAFFTGLDAQTLALLLPLFRIATLAPGTQLYAPGGIARDVFLIASGRVAIVQSSGGIETTLAELGPGEFTGERALLLPPEEHAWTAVCRDVTRVAYADGDRLAAALTASPAIGVNVARAFHRRVRDASAAIDALVASA